MKVQKLNKTSLIMGGVIFLIVAMLTIAISSMVMSNANAEEEAVPANKEVVCKFTVKDTDGNPIEGAKIQMKKPNYQTFTDCGTTEASGEFTYTYVNAENGDHIFSASKETYVTKEQSQPIDDNTQSLTLDFSLPKATQITVTANGDESVKLRHAEGWGVEDFAEDHQFTFGCEDPAKLSKEYSYTFQGVVIKEGDNALCSIKDNVDLPLTEDKVVQSDSKVIFAVDVNTSPVCTVNFKADASKIKLQETSRRLPDDCFLTTTLLGLHFNKGTSESVVSCSTNEPYYLDYYADNKENPIFAHNILLKNYIDNGEVTINFIPKVGHAEEVKVVSDKPFYMVNFDSSKGDREFTWTEEAKTTQIIDNSYFGPSPKAIYFAPRFFSGEESDVYGDVNSARVIISKNNNNPIGFAYEKDENNLIPFEDMEVIEWCGPDNRTPKTISIGGVSLDSAESTAQTGDLTYIAIALLVCVGITSAVVAVRVRARRK